MWITVVSIVLIMIIFLQFSGKDGESEETTVPVRAIGAETAPVIIKEYSDFGCATCRTWHQLGILDMILEQYGDVVRFEWHDFPVITSNSPKAAEAGLCANDQNQFWQFHNLVFQNYPNISEKDLKNYALEMGLELNEFNTCLDSGKYKQVVEQELNTAYDLGFRGTPSFLVNDKPLIGPPSFDQLATLIEEILAGVN